MSLPVYFAFLLACAVVMIGPSPALTLIVASRLRHGRRAGMLNAAGIQLGLASTAGIVLLGLASLIAAMGVWFVRVLLAVAAAWSSCRAFQQAPNETEQITIMLPPNIAITTKPQVSIAKAGATPIELAWQRCTPAGCFASAPLSDEAIGAFSAQTEPGRIVFKDAAEREAALPLSFRGLAQVYAAPAKEQ
jgi:invasion protein IalB